MRQLEQNLERMMAAVEAAGIGVWYYDIEHREVFWNQRAAELMGLTVAVPAPFQVFLQTLLPEDRSTFELQINSIISGSDGLAAEFRVRWPTENLRWLQCRLHPVREDGKLLGISGTLVDVTKIKQQEMEREQLLTYRERQQELLRRLFENAPIGIAVIDARTGTYVLANPTFEAVPGVPGVSVVGHHVGDFVPPETAEFMRQILHRVVQTGQPFRVREYEASVGPGRQHTWWNNDVVPLVDQNGQVESLLALTQEVTEEVLARKRVEVLASQMQAARDQLETIIQSMEEGLVVIDAQGNILSANPAALTMHGYGSLDEVSRNLMGYPNVFEMRLPSGEILRREDWPVARAMRGERLSHVELQGRRTDTGKSWVASYSVAPIFGPQNQVAYVILTIHDLGPMKQAQAALLHSEQRFQALAAATFEGVVLSEDGVITDTNEQFARMLGYDREELIGGRLSQFIHEEDRPRIMRNVQRHLESHVEFRMVRKDGQVITVEGHGRDAQYLNRSVRFTAIRDITDRKLAERSLSEAKRQQDEVVTVLDSLLANAPIGFAFFDRQYRHVRINDVLADLKGLRPEELLGKTVREAVPQMADKIEPIIDRVFETAQSVENQELTIENQDSSGKKTERHWLTAWYPVLMPHGAQPLVGVVVMDITRRKELERRLRRQTEELGRLTSDLMRSNQDLEQFAHVASHDLQEPLRMISGHLQLIKNRLKENIDPATEESMFFAIDGASRMQELIRDLLAFSRIGTSTEDFKSVDLNDCVRRAIRQLQARIEESAADIELQELPTVVGDEMQLTQLFQNLIDNAIKYSKEDHRPHITIGGRREKDHWLLQVKDNGIGIEPQFRERVFNLFDRLHARSKYSGTGIGLAVCKRIVERHDGRIYVESEPGKGSTFFISLPTNGKE